MELVFKSNSLKKKCEKGVYFKNNVYLNTKLIKVISDLDASSTLLDIKLNRSLHLHPLEGGRKFELAIDIDGRNNPYRLIFQTLDGENIFNEFYNNDKFKTVKKIKILEVVDYH